MGKCALHPYLALAASLAVATISQAQTDSPRTPSPKGEWPPWTQTSQSKGVPSNDDFANAEALSFFGSNPDYVIGNNSSATSEVGEPVHGVGGNERSVWYRAVFANSGNATFETISGGDTVLAVYSGATLGTLVQLGTDDDGGVGNLSSLTLSVTSGVEYSIAVETYSSGIGGEFTLKVTPPASGGGGGGPVDCSELHLSFTQPVENHVVDGGSATIVGSVQEGASSELDFVMVLDSSGSLTTTDPSDFRSQAAINLLGQIPTEVPFRASVVDFDSDAVLLSSLTDDVPALTTIIDAIDQFGSTNIQAGLESAIAELDANGGAGAQKIILLFSDGDENIGNALPVAIASPYIINTLYLGTPGSAGALLLEEIAIASGGTFDTIDDPSQLPSFFAQAGSDPRIDSIEIRSSADSQFVLTIPRSEFVLGYWTAHDVPVIPTVSVPTEITATLVSIGPSPCTIEQDRTVFSNGVISSPVESWERY